jgi:transcriptional regulator with XRE-family HTH domain
MEFKDKVLAVRTKLIISQEQLAKDLGCSFSTVNRWENGKIPPSFLLKTRFNNFCKERGITFGEDIK